MRCTLVLVSLMLGCTLDSSGLAMGSSSSADDGPGPGSSTGSPSDPSTSTSASASTSTSRPSASRSFHAGTLPSQDGTCGTRNSWRRTTRLRGAEG